MRLSSMVILVPKVNPVKAPLCTLPCFGTPDEDTPYIDVARSVAENTAVGMGIGKPVSATGADDGILFYELLGTPDLEDDDGHVRFTIDSASGQIRVGEELGADAGEREDEDRAETPLQRLERGDTAGAGQPLQPEMAGPQQQRLERGDTGGAG